MPQNDRREYLARISNNESVFLACDALVVIPSVAWLNTLFCHSERSVGISWERILMKAMKRCVPSARNAGVVWKE